MSYNFESIEGLGSLAIENLSVQPGTERVEFGCLETLWNAVFDITIASSANFSVNDVGAGVHVSGCLLDIVRGFRGGVNTKKPSMRSVVSLSGALKGRTATVNFADLVWFAREEHACIETIT